MWVWQGPLQELLPCTGLVYSADPLLGMLFLVGTNQIFLDLAFIDSYLLSSPF